MNQIEKQANRSPALIILAVVYILLGLGLLVAVLLNITFFGWLSLPLGFMAITPIAASITALVKNNPSWILLDLIIPG